MAIDGSNIFVTDEGNNSLLKFDKTGKLLKSVGQKGSGEGEFTTPRGITIVGGEVFVCDFWNHRLQVFTSDLEFLRRFGTFGKGEGQIRGPFDVTRDEEGNLYVTDWGNDRVQILTTRGKFLRFLTTRGHITNPAGISISRELLYVSQYKENGELFVYHKNGHKVCSFACGVFGRWGCAVDRDGFIYVCDPKECQVIVY